MDWSAQWVRLAVPANIATFVVGGPFRLDLYANTTAHERWIHTSNLAHRLY